LRAKRTEVLIRIACRTTIIVGNVMSSPLIINLAPTGMVPTRADSALVPLAIEEIADDVARCAALGVAMVHLHARDAGGAPTNDPAIVALLIETVRLRVPDIVITATTSGRRAADVEQRAGALYLEGAAKPDMASLTLASMNFARDASVNAPATVMRLAEIMLERDIKPELEVFDLGMVNFAHVLIDKGLIKPPYYFNLLLGNPATAQATLLHLCMLVNDLPPGSVWSVAGIGRFQTRATALGVAMGDGVRTGLEDNLWLDDGRTVKASNAQLVQRAAALAKAQGRPLASARDVRIRLGLREPA
jgi:3-keto-5-aminohexanoate cleavage enzyme